MKRGDPQGKTYHSLFVDIIFFHSSESNFTFSWRSPRLYFMNCSIDHAVFFKTTTETCRADT